MRGLAQRLQPSDVGERLGRADMLAVIGGEGIGVTRRQHRRIGGVRGGERGGERIRPGDGRERDVGFQPRDVDAVPGRPELDDGIDAGDRRLAEGRAGMGDLAAERCAEDLADLQPHRARIAVARHIGEGRDEAVEAVEAQEGLDPRPLQHMHDAERLGEQFVLRDLEEIVAREGFDDMGERLAVMAARIEPGALDDARLLAPQQRDFGRELVIGRRGEEADEAPLADQPA